MSSYVNLAFVVLVVLIFFVGYGLPFLFSSHSDLGVAGGMAICILFAWVGTSLVIKQMERIERKKNEKK